MALTTATAQTWTTFNSMQLIEEVSHGAHTVPLKNIFSEFWNSDIEIRNYCHIPAKFYGDMKFFAIKRWVLHVIQQPMLNSHNSPISFFYTITFYFAWYDKKYYCSLVNLHESRNDKIPFSLLISASSFRPWIVFSLE